ncbi:hypothetical protein C8F01DRAFT_1260459 [Mycena amicta]|nr:hypothetical protein C8F01DRAFT_1260459 [Mycena amicta]
MVNAEGTNGADNGTRPSDEILRDILLDFSRRQLSIKVRLAKLGSKHGYFIGKNKLSRLNKDFNIPSVRKPPPTSIATTLIAEVVLQDTNQRHGPVRTQRKIARRHNMLIPRDTVRKIQKEIDPEGAEARFPGRKKAIKVRGQLTAVGIMEEVHCDGHEKLGPIALRLGGVVFGIYGFRDHTGRILHLEVVPNDRDRLTICHCYLDFVEVTGEIPIQLTFDGGTETGYMASSQHELRRRYLPELLESTRPATRALKSMDNIPIESGWKYWIDDEGANIKTALLEAHTNGLFAPGNQIHINLFQWLWSRIIRHHLQEWKYYFNSTARRSQKDKLLPTAAPDEVFSRPEDFGLERCGTGIPRDVIDEMRGRLPVTREQVMRWVPDEFNEVAEVTYEEIGSPKLVHSTGWETYRAMLTIIQDVYA